MTGENSNDRRARRLSHITNSFRTAAETIRQSQEQLPGAIIAAADTLYSCFQQGGKVLVCGNGGSAADAQHLTAEWIGRFKPPIRRALPAISLAADPVFITAWANDVSFDNIFARQVEALGKPEDVLMGISTSGRSKNIIAAFEAAKNKGMKRIAVLGGQGGELAHRSDVAIVVPAQETARIQEVHLLVFHLLCELIEQEMTTS